MKDLVIVGAGGFGREVQWLAERMNGIETAWNLLGYVDDGVETGSLVDGLPVLGGCEWLSSRRERTCVAVAIGSSATRKRVVGELAGNPALDFPALIDPAAIVSNRVAMGRGCIICAGSILTVDIEMGDFVIVNLDCTVGHDACLRDFTTLYPSVNVSGNTILGETCEMGTGSAVIQGRSIGAGSIIGAGATVVRDIPAGCTAVGCPAKPIKFHDGSKNGD